MSDPDETGPADDTFDEIREAAGAVVSSLKQLIDATERVIEDPAAFSQAVDGGRSIVEAFIGGFTGQSADATAESDEVADES